MAHPKLEEQLKKMTADELLALIHAVAEDVKDTIETAWCDCPISVNPEITVKRQAAIFDNIHLAGIINHHIRKWVVKKITEDRAPVELLIDDATEDMTWPDQQEVGRMGDMGVIGESHLRVGLDADNDVYVTVFSGAEDPQFASIEFCTPFFGGGKSPKTRIALINLMNAMIEDNKEDPLHQYPPVDTK